MDSEGDRCVIGWDDELVEALRDAEGEGRLLKVNIETAAGVGTTPEPAVIPYWGVLPVLLLAALAAWLHGQGLVAAARDPPGPAAAGSFSGAPAPPLRRTLPPRMPRPADGWSVPPMPATERPEPAAEPAAGAATKGERPDVEKLLRRIAAGAGTGLGRLDVENLAAHWGVDALQRERPETLTKPAAAGEGPGRDDRSGGGSSAAASPSGDRSAKAQERQELEPPVPPRPTEHASAVDPRQQTEEEERRRARAAALAQRALSTSGEANVAVLDELIDAVAFVEFLRRGNRGEMVLKVSLASPW